MKDAVWWTKRFFGILFCAWLLCSVGWLIRIWWDEKKHPTPGFKFSAKLVGEVFLYAFPGIVIVYLVALIQRTIILIQFVIGFVETYGIPILSGGKFTTGEDRVKETGIKEEEI